MRPQIRLFIVVSMFITALFVMTTLTEAQPPGGKGKGGKGAAESASDFVNRMMAFDKNKDGKLTKEELTDTRLHPLFDRADTKKNGYVTPQDLEALYAREGGGEGGGGKGGPGGDKGKGPPDGKDKKGKGKGGFGGPPQPGVVLTPGVQDVLNLNDVQRKQIGDLQKDVEARLDKILTSDQQSLLKQMRDDPKGFGPGDKKGKKF